jgi:hypothetical protein
VIIDLRRNASPAEIDAEIDRMQLNAINRWWTKMTFQTILLKNAHSVSEMEAFVAQTPFRSCHIDIDKIGFTLWMEK